MAMQESYKIESSDIITEFKKAVVTPILSGTYHSGNIPKCSGYQCVPTSMMDHLNNVEQTPVLDTNGTKINATSLITTLVSMTRDLTRVGTYSFAIYKRCSNWGDTWTTQIASSSGAVIFNTNYIRAGFSLPTSSYANTVLGNVISASDLNTLFANIYSTWANTSRQHYSSSETVCHESCHVSCHTDCHVQCHSSCHGWNYSRDMGEGNGTDWNRYSSCHSNYGNACYAI